MKHSEQMKLALAEAYRGIKKRHGGPFGAVIVRKGKVLSKAHNTVLKDNDPTQHAEVRAISAAARKLGTYDLSECVLYSTTEPCPMCFSAIHWARIDCVVFGTSINDVAKLGFNELAISVRKMKKMGKSPLAVKSDVLLKECRALLAYWNKLPDKQLY